MPDFLQNVDFWIAVLGGGAFVKVVDYLLPAILNRKSRGIAVGHEEKDDLRDDIEYLRNEIEKLRREVTKLKDALQKREREVSIWQRNYWRKKMELDKVIWQVRHYGDETVKAKVLETLSEDDGDPEPPEDE